MCVCVNKLFLSVSIYNHKSLFLLLFTTLPVTFWPSHLIISSFCYFLSVSLLILSLSFSLSLFHSFSHFILLFTFCLPPHTFSFSQGVCLPPHLFCVFYTLDFLSYPFILSACLHLALSSSSSVSLSLSFVSFCLFSSFSLSVSLILSLFQFISFIHFLSLYLFLPVLTLSACLFHSLSFSLSACLLSFSS